ncbi:hypothetical protein EVAR_62884_1 [Eumeta japonica]|uniref:Uncharacterized protein n=1 Tax=Eumeta variegata TaxID=151549 RepID=A0A4C1ZUU1_EUMVA|nr:hypothetical protein EVAR_62884_1 [Eumeta japonica]
MMRSRRGLTTVVAAAVTSSVADCLILMCSLRYGASGLIKIKISSVIKSFLQYSVVAFARTFACVDRWNSYVFDAWHKAVIAPGLRPRRQGRASRAMPAPRSLFLLSGNVQNISPARLLKSRRRPASRRDSITIFSCEFTVTPYERFRLFYFFLRREGNKKPNELSRTRVRVRFSRTKTPPKQHVGWLLSVAPTNGALRTSSIAADQHGMPSARNCSMDATKWASRHRKSCGDSARVECLIGVPGAREAHRLGDRLRS